MAGCLFLDMKFKHSPKVYLQPSLVLALVRSDRRHFVFVTGERTLLLQTCLCINQFHSSASSISLLFSMWLSHIYSLQMCIIDLSEFWLNGIIPLVREEGKGVFPCLCDYLGVQAQGFCLCKAPRGHAYCKRQHTNEINWIKLNWSP